MNFNLFDYLHNDTFTTRQKYLVSQVHLVQYRNHVVSKATDTPVLVTVVAFIPTRNVFNTVLNIDSVVVFKC